MGDFQRTDGLRSIGQAEAEEGAGDDAEENPERQVTLEESERGAAAFLPATSH